MILFFCRIFHFAPVCIGVLTNEGGGVVYWWVGGVPADFGRGRWILSGSSPVNFLVFFAGNGYPFPKFCVDRWAGACVSGSRIQAEEIFFGCVGRVGLGFCSKVTDKTKSLDRKAH